MEDIIATLSAQASSLSNTMETLMMRNSIAPTYPIPSISCIYCKGSHSFDNCPYNPDSLCYGFLPSFANQHQYQCFQQEKMIPKEPSIEELMREYMAKCDVVMQSQTTILQNLEIQVEQIADELQNRSQGIFIENRETSKQEQEEKECEVASLKTELEHEDHELPVEQKGAPTLDDIKEPKGREEIKEEPPQEEKEPPKEVAVSYAVAISPKMTSNVLPIPEGLAFTYCNLQEMLNEEECKKESMKDDNVQYVTQIATATFKGTCKSLEHARPVVIKAPQLRLKSRPTSRPRCKMKEHGCGLPTGIG